MKTKGPYTRDSAIEHGKYLANAAEMLLSSINKRDSIINDNVSVFSDEEIQDAETEVSESWEYMQTAIYEFRKRADNLAHPFAWITNESLDRLADGGNCNGSVPIHLFKSHVAKTPVYK